MHTKIDMNQQKPENVKINPKNRAKSKLPNI